MFSWNETVLCIENQISSSRTQHDSCAIFLLLTLWMPVNRYFGKLSEGPDEMQHNVTFLSGFALFAKIKLNRKT